MVWARSHRPHLRNRNCGFRLLISTEIWIEYDVADEGGVTYVTKVVFGANFAYEWKDDGVEAVAGSRSRIVVGFAAFIPARK